MDSISRKPRRIETLDERASRRQSQKERTVESRLSEDEAMDAMVRKSIATHGA